ncbi:hypothetical protein, partial [Eubacterium sp.]|uniref:hypothetical protein n=1 Tax=Eubacterium sp. TaxID=142586 RepID=UPI002FC8B89A
REFSGELLKIKSLTTTQNQAIIRMYLREYQLISHIFVNLFICLSQPTKQRSFTKICVFYFTIEDINFL